MTMNNNASQIVYEKVEEAKSYINQGMSADDAVIKSAAGMNVEFTKRIIEGVNEDLFLEVLEKSADPSGDFEIANPYRIIGQEIEKADSKEKIASLNDDSFYADLNGARVKSACATPYFHSQEMPENIKEFYLLRKQAAVQKKAEKLEVDFAMARDIYQDASINLLNYWTGKSKEKIASDISEIYGRHGKDALKLIDIPLKALDIHDVSFQHKKACYDGRAEIHNMFDPVKKSFDLLMPISKEMKKYAGIGSVIKSALFGLGKKKVKSKPAKPVRPSREGLAEGILVGSKGKSVADAQKWLGNAILGARDKEEAKLHGEKQRFLGGLVEDAYSKKLDAYSDQTEQYAEDLKEYEKWKTESEEKGKARKEKVLGGILDGATSTGRALAAPGRTAAKVMAAKSVQLGNREQAQAKNLSKEIETDMQVGALSDAFKHREIFEELVENDEIISQEDPVEMAEMYETLKTIAPNVAANKSLTRAVLRQMSSQGTMSPYDATVFSKLDRILDKNFSGTVI